MADQPHCVHCGEPGQYNAYSRAMKAVPDPVTGRRTVVHYHKPLQKPGWAHADGMRRDHTFEPEEGRTPEADLARQEAAFDQAKSHVRGVLQKNFDYLHAQDEVNDIFRDRRG